MFRWRSFISFTELFQKLFIPDIFLYLPSKMIFLHFSLDWIFCHFDFTLLFSQITTCYKNHFTNFYQFFQKFGSVSICSKSIYYDDFWQSDFFDILQLFIVFWLSKIQKTFYKHEILIFLGKVCKSSEKLWKIWKIFAPNIAANFCQQSGKRKNTLSILTVTSQKSAKIGFFKIF